MGSRGHVAAYAARYSSVGLIIFSRVAGSSIIPLREHLSTYFGLISLFIPKPDHLSSHIAKLSHGALARSCDERLDMCWFR